MRVKGVYAQSGYPPWFILLKAVAVPSSSDQRKAAPRCTPDEVRNVQQKAVLLIEVSILWTKKSAAILQHSSELL